MPVASALSSDHVTMLHSSFTVLIGGTCASSLPKKEGTARSPVTPCRTGIKRWTSISGGARAEHGCHTTSLSASTAAAASAMHSNVVHV